MTQPNKPIKIFRDDAIKATIWRNQNDQGDAWHSVIFTRSYKDKKGEWQTATSFSGKHLPAISRLAERAHEFSNQ